MNDNNVKTILKYVKSEYKLLWIADGRRHLVLFSLYVLLFDTQQYLPISF